MKTIFDSKKALNVANNNNDDYFVSSPFLVHPSRVAHLMLTAPASRYRDVSFTVLRFPGPLAQSNIASCLEGIYSQLNTSRANEPTPFPHNKSLSQSHLVTLGQQYEADTPTPHCFDYITIERPGNYMLYAPRIHNPLICDPKGFPVIVEVAIT